MGHYEDLWRRRYQRRRYMIGGAVGLAAGVGGTLLLLLLALGYERPVDEAAGSPSAAGVPASLGPCAELAGLPTSEVVDVGLCDDQAPSDTILISAGFDCADGRTLHWNDWGWGYDDGDWMAPLDDGSPPEGEMASCLAG